MPVSRYAWLTLALCLSSWAHAAPVEGVFAGKGDLPLQFRIFQAPLPKGAVVMVNGYSETQMMYEELEQQLNAAGYTVYSYDHRGQGLSARLISDPEVGYVENFDDYVDDLGLFVEKVVKPRETSPPALISHSTGGLISAFYAARHPEAFRKMVFSAPYFEINTHWMPEWLALFIVRASCAVGRCERYAFTQGSFDADKYQFEDNHLTHSRSRFEYLKAMVWKKPQLLIRGASNRWLRETIAASRRILDSATAIKAPILLLQAGDDFYVKPFRQDEFCARTTCTKVRLAGSFHEILLEDDPIRDLAVSAILKFLADP